MAHHAQHDRIEFWQSIDDHWMAWDTTVWFEEFNECLHEEAWLRHCRGVTNA